MIHGCDLCTGVRHVSGDMFKSIPIGDAIFMKVIFSVCPLLATFGIVMWKMELVDFFVYLARATSMVEIVCFFFMNVDRSEAKGFRVRGRVIFDLT